MMAQSGRCLRIRWEEAGWSVRFFCVWSVNFEAEVSVVCNLCGKHVFEL